MPTIKEIKSLLIHLKKSISDEYRATCEDDIPSLQVTVATNYTGSEWSYQIGDNSYTGAAYLFPNWAVISLYRHSNCLSLAKDIINQLEELKAE